MKKLNVQVYQGSPDGVITKDNNNLFIEGDVQYSTGAGTIVKSITSVKTADGTELLPPPVEEFPYEYTAVPDFSVIIQPKDWDEGEEYYNANITAPEDLPEIVRGIIFQRWGCNKSYCSYDEDFGEIGSWITLPLGSGEEHPQAFVRFSISKRKIDIVMVDSNELSASQITGPVTLNFTDILFIGNKKSE